MAIISKLLSSLATAAAAAAAAVFIIIILLLGRVALVAQQPIVIKLSRGQSVGLCVGRSVQ